MALGASNGRTVAGLVTAVLARVGAVVCVVALVAVAGVVAASVAVSRLTGDLEPAVAANRAVLQDLTEMDAATSDWALTREPSAVDAYDQARSRLSGHQGQVRAAVAGSSGLSRLVSEQEEAVGLWISDYAAPRIARTGEGAAGSLQQERRLSRAGDELYADVLSAHQQTQGALDARVRSADRQVTWVLRGTILGVVALAVLATLLLGRAKRRFLVELSEPLRGLESVVHKMARRESHVRAAEHGPKEVRAVAAALNDLADAQARAQAVESRIQNELRVLDTAKDDFVSNVSHELRTPLTTISGYLELVAEEFEGKMEPRHERILEATRRNVTRLKTLIDDLLTLSKAESRPADLEQGELGGILRDAVTDVRITAARRSIGVRVDIAEPLPVLADRAMLQRAFLNVLTNAVKFSREGGQVEVSARHVGHDVVVSVTDHGIGIPAAELDRLGTRFFRASNAVTNEIAGTGLGLRIVQTIVDRHGGDVVIESREGVGTTVALRLRLQPAPLVVEPVSGPVVGPVERGRVTAAS
ncbi:sensor histidine kinase [Nocardioides ferulae]|uniref:sensor histidine kinase n=1 Tax=Nocardioides ferulae TaxID=2340821 RepID=UPI000F879B4A|nr:ATP-binding protein [Nocardioides ferulae]